MLERRHYTIEEARRTLPLVRRIVADIAGTARALAEDGDSERLQGRLKRTIQELETLGIELKDPVQGLIDFYWLRGDETAYLCWKLGEETIGHWHDLESGYAGRRPLD